MKRIMLSIVLLLFMVAGARANGGLTLWGITGDGADHAITARVGWTVDKVEAGACVSWFTAEPEWGPEPDVYGAYGIFHVNEFVDFDDPSPNSLWEDWLHRLVGRPYIGLEGLIPCDGHDRTILINYLVGTLITLAEDADTQPDFRLGRVVEYKAGQAVASAADHSDSLVAVGLRYEFR